MQLQSKLLQVKLGNALGERLTYKRECPTQLSEQTYYNE